MRALLLTTSLCFGLASLAQAAPKTLKFEQGTATYTNRDAFASWEGNTSDIGGTLILDDQTGALVKGEIQIGLAAIDSGNGARDARMRGEFLQTEKYPKATLWSPSSKVSRVSPSGRNGASSRPAKSTAI